MDLVRFSLPIPDLRRDRLVEERDELLGSHAGGWMVSRKDCLGWQEKQLRQKASAAGATGDSVHRWDEGDCRNRREVESVNWTDIGVRHLQRGDLRRAPGENGMEGSRIRRQGMEKRNGDGRAEGQSGGASG